MSARSASTLLRRRMGLLAGTTVLVALALPTGASASHHAKAKKTTKATTCLSATALSAATKATWPAPTIMPSFYPGVKVCTYLSASTGATFVINHEPLDGSSLKEIALSSYGNVHRTSVPGIGKAAIRVTGGLDVLLVEQGSNAYVFVDNSGASSLAQLKAVAKLVIPS